MDFATVLPVVLPSERVFRLYELPKIYEQIDALLDESEGEITPEIEFLLEGLQGTLAERGEWLAKSAIEAEARADARKPEIERLQKLRQRDMKKAESFKKIIIALMDATGVTRIETGAGPIKVQQNGGIQPIGWIGEIAECPSEFVKYEPKIDMKEVQQAFKSGELPLIRNDDPEDKTPGFVIYERGRHVRFA